MLEKQILLDCLLSCRITNLSYKFYTDSKHKVNVNSFEIKLLITSLFTSELVANQEKLIY